MTTTIVKLLTAGLLFLTVGVTQAGTITYFSVLGPEAPGATGNGTASILYDDVALTLTFDVDWSGLSGTTTVAHVHCCVASPGSGTVGVAVTPGTLPGFPAGVTSGSYNMTIDLADAGSYTAGFLTSFGGGSVDGARAALLAGMAGGTAYFNIHSTFVPSGEIRGFLQQVPAPAPLILLGIGLLATGASRRRRS
jgi:hypothetical protein